jgi:hypothetical protein
MPDIAAKKSELHVKRESLCNTGGLGCYIEIFKASIFISFFSILIDFLKKKRNSRQMYQKAIHMELAVTSNIFS